MSILVKNYVEEQMFNELKDRILSWMIKKLEAAGLVDYLPYKGVNHCRDQQQHQ